jgi:DNA-binding CsgD family transcriptional regulator
MPLREAEDRRGRTERGGSGLLERDVALRAIMDALDEAQQGSGSAVLIEGHPGMGKSRLHEAALDEARRRRLRVLRAAGSELERHMAFGVAAQLLRAQLAQLPVRERDELLAAAPEPIRALVGAAEPTSSPGSDLALSHGLFTIIATAERLRPALIAIDDLHWADPSSLRFVLYMLQRLEELPAAIVMTRRPAAGAPEAAVIDRIAAHPRVWIETLSALGPEAVEQLARRALGDRADDTVIEACREATSGNPFYLHELLLTLSSERKLSSRQLARHARALAPDAVTRIVRVRVGRLGSTASSLARATAILGEDVELRHAALLGGLTLEAAASAADALAAEEILLAREPLRFVHPLVRHAVANDIPASERASRHLDAAQLLGDEGVDPERIAAHLLHGRGQGSQWVIDRLRAAASEARMRGAPQSAARYLQRALEEPPPLDRRASILAELGAAEAAAGFPDAAGHFAEAAAATSDPLRRAELALERGRALEAQGMHARSAEAYDEGVRELGCNPVSQPALELHDQLQAGFITSAAMVPALQPMSVERSERLMERITDTPHTQGQRLLLAHRAARDAFAGGHASGVTELAERAWDGGRMLGDAGLQWVGWRIVCAAFSVAGELERADLVASAAVDDARGRSAPLDLATASFVRSLPRLWQGRVEEALADIEATVDARNYGWRQFERGASAHHALCLIERGELERAQEALDEHAPSEGRPDLEEVLRISALAELHLASGRPAEAFETALIAGENAERIVNYFGYCSWRTVAAEAALGLGDRERATILAEEAAARAERTGARHQRIATRRLLGICRPGAAGIEMLTEAVALGAAGPQRLEYIRALVELGAALRRSNQRAAAREPLGRAIDLARASGAIALRERARTELSATGARPRREALTSGPGSLTPSERRIAELAAGGQSNREIAQALFVTPKTVEYHLRNVYRKLEIETRRQLPGALGD